MLLQKRCTKCETMKSGMEFSKSSRRSDGLCVWCKACSSVQQKAWAKVNSDMVSATHRDYYNKNKEVLLEKMREYQSKNKETLSRKAKIHYQENAAAKDAANKKYIDARPEQARQYAAVWRGRNRHIVNSRAAARRAQVKNATPSWANYDAMQVLFSKAVQLRVSTNLPHDVDHIVPLTPPLVQGLDRGNVMPKRRFVGPLIPVVQGFHCEANLRVITETENRLKSNTSWPDMPNIKI